MWAESGDKLTRVGVGDGELSGVWMVFADEL